MLLKYDKFNILSLLLFLCTLNILGILLRTDLNSNFWTENEFGNEKSTPFTKYKYKYDWLHLNVKYMNMIIIIVLLLSDVFVCGRLPAHCSVLHNYTIMYDCGVHLYIVANYTLQLYNIQAMDVMAWFSFKN